MCATSPGATIADAKRFLLSDTDGGSGPFPPAGSEAATSVLERGTSQVITLDLKPGKYALYCFVSDRRGGPPHIVRGMISGSNRQVGPRADHLCSRRRPHALGWTPTSAVGLRLSPGL